MAMKEDLSFAQALMPPEKPTNRPKLNKSSTAVKGSKQGVFGDAISAPDHQLSRKRKRDGTFKRDDTFKRPGTCRHPNVPQQNEQVNSKQSNS